MRDRQWFADNLEAMHSCWLEFTEAKRNPAPPRREDAKPPPWGGRFSGMGRGSGRPQPVAAARIVDDLYDEDARRLLVLDEQLPDTAGGGGGGGGKPSTPISHTLLTPPYGKFAVPDHKLGDFNDTYACTVTLKGTNPGFVEIKSSLFRLFTDLDLKLAPGEALTESDRHLLIARVQKVPVGMFGASAGGVLVATCEPYAKGDIVKSGMHMVWPDLYVNGGQALCFRDACVLALNEAYGGKLLGRSDWSNIVDGSMYKEGTGLRMIGAAKNEPVATVYLPYCHMSEAGELVEAVPAEMRYNNFVGWVASTSIRVAAALTNGRQASLTGRVPAKLGAVQRQRQQQRQQGLSSGGSLIQLALGASLELLAAVRAVITHSEAVDFVTAPVRSVMLSRDKDVVKAVIVTDTKRCLNLRARKYHSSNHTCMLVEGSRVFQRCHSDKAGAGQELRHGPCSKLNLCISIPPALLRAPLVTQEQFQAASARLPGLLETAWQHAANRGP